MNVKIIPVNYDDKRYYETAELAKNCSFQGTGAFLSELMRDNEFCDFERVFSAIVNDTVVGFCAIVKESCCENDSNTPWLDFLFVDENYRNCGIAYQMINVVESYAKEIGFTSLFLCTASHQAFYQKYGFKFSYDVSINEYTDGVVMEKLL